ncbi:hypothetical protein GCM10023063_06890 [Arthrobacter methylotrophus]|uniref:TadE/TadG family type IV pilus assembly protein n=1 Tax=Arthrobacter methylotrophus TaxID=121291 RepID=A0ABV5UUA6_9MICC
MQRLIRRRDLQDRESGVAGVMVALMMLTLIGVGAVAVDVGQIYAERAQLQNGADSGALAVASSCAKGSCNTSLAGPLANANANDGASTVKSVDLSVPGRVTVTTSTKDGTTGAGYLSKMFANALNTAPVTVGAQATATWTNVPAPGALPLVFDQCQVRPAYAPPGTTVIIKEHGKSPCVGSPSGHHIPGGFGWLTETGTCQSIPDANGWVDSAPGNGKFPSDCTSTTDSWRAAIDYSQNKFAIAYFPIFDDGSGNGANGQFHIIGYAMVELHGWDFVQNSDGLPPGKADPACAGLGGSNRGICGRFLKTIPLSAAGLAGGPYFQSSVVTLVK